MSEKVTAVALPASLGDRPFRVTKEGREAEGGICSWSSVGALVMVEGGR